MNNGLSWDSQSYIAVVARLIAEKNGKIQQFHFQEANKCLGHGVSSLLTVRNAKTKLGVGEQLPPR